MLCVLILLLRMALAWDSLLLGLTVLLQSCYQHFCVDLASADAHHNTEVHPRSGHIIVVTSELLSSFQRVVGP